jgi:ubiquinone/menaquinone biosynthesis C-methylase UbiE
MPAMSRFERSFCRGGVWRSFARRRALPWVLQGRVLNGAVLELGGGDGSIAEAVLDSEPDVCVTMTDIDPQMVDAAVRRLARFGNRVSVAVADATQLAYEDESFDVVLSFIMLHHVIQWEDAIGEAVRVLRPGGVVLGYDLTDTALGRLTYLRDRKRARPMRAEELAEQSKRLPVDAKIDEAWHGLLVRFALQKPASFRAVADDQAPPATVR